MAFNVPGPPSTRTTKPQPVDPRAHGPGWTRGLPAPTKPTSTGTGSGNGLDPTENSAYQVMLGILAQYGLQSLAKVVLGYVKQGYDSTAMGVLIQSTPEWQQRFAGNALRQKNGLAPLDPATYLSTEAAYQQAVKSMGLPAGIGDDQAQWAQWIGGNVSASEVQQRASDAMSFVNSADPNARNELDAWYGTQGDAASIASYFLDQKTAVPLLEQRAQAAQIGGAAMDQGLQTTADRAQLFASQGVTTAQAQQGYGTIAKDLPGESALGDIYHTQYGQTDLEDEILGNSAAAAQKRLGINSQEEANFSGSGAVGNNLAQAGYGVANNSGAGSF